MDSIIDWILDHLIWLGALAVVLVISAPIAYVVACYHHVQHLTCTVEDKDRTSNNGSSDMRIYTKECGNLVVQDATFRKNFHSSDMYRSIHRGQVYEFTTIGFRIPFMSEFPNIVVAREVGR